MISVLRSGLERLRSRSADAALVPPGLLKNLVPLTVLAIGITALVLMYLWRDESNYKPVFGARETVAISDMLAVLDAERIPYRIHPDSGQVLVPGSALGKARMLLAAKGVVAKLPDGLELMDRNDPLGVSQFVQDVRFRRGLEGELARSIRTMDAVDSARVHLSIAKSSSFVAGDGAQSSASVIVSLKPGRQLTPEQIAATINLVAGSVASLSPQRVNLVDQAGNLLSARVDLSEGFLANEGGEAARRYQDEVRRNVDELLAPVLGRDNFRVSVTAEVDNDRIEETHEKFGEAPRVTSEAMREEQDRNQLALGVPGSLSNRPVAAAKAEESPPEGNSAQKSAATRQFAYDRSITQIKRSRGRLERLSVAVVLNSAVAPAPETGWTPGEIANIERVLRNGLGISAERGDELVVSSMAFPAPPPAVEWWKERDNLIEIGEWVASALAVLLGYLLVVRPLLRLAQRSLASSLQAPPLAAAAAGAASGAGAHPLPAPAPEAASLALPNALPDQRPQMPVVPLLENYDLPPPGSPVDVMVDHLKVLAGKEPERVAEVVKQWVQKHGRSE
ncbi:MAG TPA: flagellar basal-body MS-ring/collar protein FliF [Zeimonas sp.]|nr:flagellar basal-body MS-ring/collar protein FliF [Zeimonas sp.]